MTVVSAAVEGFVVSAGFIVAIGAQNALVLRQGIERRHVFAVATVCTLSDAILIGAGVAGLGPRIQSAPTLLVYVTLAGAAFLAFCSAMSLRRAFRSQRLQPSLEKSSTLSATIVTCLALTWLNPHVYLDTVVLIGSLSAAHPPPTNIAFGVGSIAASAVWFYGLAYSARLLAPWFAQPKVWRILDLVIGIAIGIIAIRLVAELL